MTTETQTAATPAAAEPAAAPVVAPDATTLLTPAAEPTAAPVVAPEAAEPAKADPAVAPEQYADFTLPEGLGFNDEVLGEFKTLAKEKNLTQEDAQKFTDLGAKLIQESQAKQIAQLEAAQTEWAETARTDKEFGGDKLTENMAVASKALEAFGSPELTKMLVESKLGNHPEIIRAFYRVGKAISEDRLIPGGVRPEGNDVLKNLYPTMTK